MFVYSRHYFVFVRLVSILHNLATQFALNVTVFRVLLCQMVLLFTARRPHVSFRVVLTLTVGRHCFHKEICNKKEYEAKV